MKSSSPADVTKRSFLATLAAVFWSFVGLRRRSDYEKDVSSLNPFYVIGAGLLGVGIFIAVLILAVRVAVAG